MGENDNSDGHPKPRKWEDLSGWGKLKLGFGFVLSLGIGGITFYIALSQQAWLSLLIWFLGGILGWISGIFLSPITSTQRDLFRDYGKAITAFISGFVLAKLDRLWESAVPEGEPVPELLSLNLLLFLIAFGLGFLLTFVGRTSEFYLAETK